MSELYSVAVGQVAGPRVDLIVTTVHPDAGPPPDEPSFPLNLLVDLWDLLERGFAGLIDGIPRMSDDDAKALARRAPWGAAFPGLRDLSRGAQVSITQAEYETLKTGSTWKGQRLAGWGFSSGAYYVHLPGDEDGFRATARTLVKSYTQDEKQNQNAYQAWPEWNDNAAYDQQLPRARLVVEMNDEALLGFVKAGMRFDTAAYF